MLILLAMTRGRAQQLRNEWRSQPTCALRCCYAVASNNHYETQTVDYRTPASNYAKLMRQLLLLLLLCDWQYKSTSCWYANSSYAVRTTAVWSTNNYEHFQAGSRRNVSLSWFFHLFFYLAKNPKPRVTKHLRTLVSYNYYCTRYQVSYGRSRIIGRHRHEDFTRITSYSF